MGLVYRLAKSMVYSVVWNCISGRPTEANPVGVRPLDNVAGTDKGGLRNNIAKRVARRSELPLSATM